MMLTKIKKILFKYLVILLIAGQFSFVGTFLLAPKPAQAFWGIGDFTFNTEVANWYDVFKDIGLAAAQRVAISYANKYITRFVDKVIDKYRIKDYLAYEKVLSGYYLNQYIYQNVGDPDLRAIYGILATDISTRATVSDKDGNKIPVLAALRQKLDDYYILQGGISSSRIYNPNTFSNDREYFAAAQSYFSNPPNFSQTQLYGEFGQLVADSQSAASQEIASGDGIKNDRSAPPGVIPHVCEGYDIDFEPEEGEETSMISDFLAATGLVYKASAAVWDNEADCKAKGGTWEVDKSGMFQSVIQNPSAFIHDFATGGIKQIFETNFGLKDNIYTTIGSLLGNFIFNKLNLNTNQSGSVVNEKGSEYVPDGGSGPLLKNIDLDGDNIPEGQDADGDDKLNTAAADTCYHGGVAPNCLNSTKVVTSPYFTPICQSIDRAVTSLTEFSRFIDTYADQLEGGASLKGQIIGAILLGPVGAIFGGLFGSGSIDNFKNKADADVWARRAGEVNSAMEDIINNIQNYHSSYFDNMEFTVGRYSVFIGDVLQSLQKDKDLDLARFGSGGGGLKNLMINTGYILRYLIEIKKVIGKCENPNLKAVDGVPTPKIVDPGGGGDGEEIPPPPDALAKHPSRKDIVAEAKAEAEAFLGKKYQYSSPECPDRFEIAKRTAWKLRGEGAGLLSKPGGNNCIGYAVDIVIFTDGYIFDISGGGPETDGNVPRWSPAGCKSNIEVEIEGTCPDRYRPPIQPEGT